MRRTTQVLSDILVIAGVAALYMGLTGLRWGTQLGGLLPAGPAALAIVVVFYADRWIWGPKKTHAQIIEFLARELAAQGFPDPQVRDALQKLRARMR